MSRANRNERDGRGVNEEQRQRRVGRSVRAVVSGMLVGFVLTIATDLLLHMAGVFPRWGQPVETGPLVLATAYRMIFSVFACYLMARLAPGGPMGHALVGGAIGLAISALGAAVTWNRGPAFGPHWYPVAVAAIALPCAWLGGKIRLVELGRAQRAVR